jgi:hypothetical protein
MAAQLAVGTAHSVRQIAVEVRRDQMGHHLGVGLGPEIGALRDEALLQLGPVLDDPVEHDVNAP